MKVFGRRKTGQAPSVVKSPSDAIPYSFMEIIDHSCSDAEYDGDYRSLPKISRKNPRYHGEQCCQYSTVCKHLDYGPFSAISHLDSFAWQIITFRLAGLHEITVDEE